MTKEQYATLNILSQAIVDKDESAKAPWHDLLCECGYPTLAGKHLEGCLQIGNSTCAIVAELLNFSNKRLGEIKAKFHKEEREWIESIRKKSSS